MRKCHNCGYDLAGLTAAHPVCPECGKTDTCQPSIPMAVCIAVQLVSPGIVACALLLPGHAASAIFAFVVGVVALPVVGAPSMYALLGRLQVTRVASRSTKAGEKLACALLAMFLSTVIAVFVLTAIFLAVLVVGR